MPPVFIVAQVEAAPAHIQWRVIAAVAGYPAQTRVFIKAVTAAGVANQTETIPAAEIINPEQGCIRSGNYIFPGFVIKVTGLHIRSFTSQP
jgi:hypothetical protein